MNAIEILWISSIFLFNFAQSLSHWNTIIHHILYVEFAHTLSQLFRSCQIPWENSTQLLKLSEVEPLSVETGNDFFQQFANSSPVSQRLLSWIGAWLIAATWIRHIRIYFKLRKRSCDHTIYDLGCSLHQTGSTKLLMVWSCDPSACNWIECDHWTSSLYQSANYGQSTGVGSFFAEERPPVLKTLSGGRV